MKTVKETAMELLLKGEHINKGQFHATYGTFTLTQRIEEIRKEGWDVRSKTIPGRKGMVEYWLEQDEIDRLSKSFQKFPKVSEEKNTQYIAKSEEMKSDEQSVEEKQNLAETAQKTAENEKYEQLGIGLLGGTNY